LILENAKRMDHLNLKNVFIILFKFFKPHFKGGHRIFFSFATEEFGFIGERVTRDGDSFYR